jgi:hypothetical protein
LDDGLEEFVCDNVFEIIGKKVLWIVDGTTKALWIDSSFSALLYYHYTSSLEKVLQFGN